MQYLGDYLEDATLDFKFSTHQADGTPITLAGTPAVSVYKANGTTESTAGVTLTVDFDSRTGCHHVRVDLSADAFYAVANDYSIVITTGTVGGVSVVGTVLATFSIENRMTVDEIVNAVLDAFGSRVTAQTGSTSSSIILDSGASSTDDYYNGSVIGFTSGALNGHAPIRITDYVGSTKTATLQSAFSTAPSNGDTAFILGRIE